MVDGKSGARSPDGCTLPGRSAAAGIGRVVCAGGLVIDRTYRAARPVRPGTSNPVSGSRAFGGVAGNVAVNLARLGVAAALVSVVGADEGGRALVRHAADLGIDTAGILRSVQGSTAEYIALLGPDGELELGMADMAVFDALTPAAIRPGLGALDPRDWIFADCNLPVETLAWLADRDARGGAKLAIDVVSTPKADRLPPRLDGIDLLFLNRDEAAALLQASVARLTPAEAIAGLLARGAAAVVLTLGPQGLAVGGEAAGVTLIEAAPVTVVDVTGAGDALVATTLAYLLTGAGLAAAARWGGLAAALTLSCSGSTHPGLGRDRLAAAAREAAPALLSCNTDTA